MMPGRGVSALNVAATRVVLDETANVATLAWAAPSGTSKDPAVAILAFSVGFRECNIW